MEINFVNTLQNLNLNKILTKFITIIKLFVQQNIIWID